MNQYRKLDYIRAQLRRMENDQKSLKKYFMVQSLRKRVEYTKQKLAKENSGEKQSK